jgi:hypothetical protein
MGSGSLDPPIPQVKDVGYPPAMEPNGTVLLPPPPGERSTRLRLMVVVGGVIVVVVSAGAVILPNFLASNLCSNEVAAIATLRNLASCQNQFKSLLVAVDTNQNGIGEYGTMQELTGSIPLRAPPGQVGKTLNPPVISPSLARVTTEGWVEKAHYAFAVFLPKTGGGWIRESSTWPANFAATESGCTSSGTSVPGTSRISPIGTVDAALAEQDWCAIAWPRMIDGITRRMFFVTAHGEVFQTNNERGVICETVLPSGPDAVLPPGWKHGDEIKGPYTSSSGDVWRFTN